jgi:hypothetical protein
MQHRSRLATNDDRDRGRDAGRHEREGEPETAEQTTAGTEHHLRPVGSVAGHQQDSESHVASRRSSATNTDALRGYGPMTRLPVRIHREASIGSESACRLNAGD